MVETIKRRVQPYFVLGGNVAFHYGHPRGERIYRIYSVRGSPASSSVSRYSTTDITADSLPQLLGRSVAQGSRHLFRQRRAMVTEEVRSLLANGAPQLSRPSRRRSSGDHESTGRRWHDRHGR